MHLDSEGNPTNLTELDIRVENGIFKAEATGAGNAEKVLYNGGETVPVAPGSYPVTCIIKIDGSEMELPIGTLVIPEPASPGETGHLWNTECRHLHQSRYREMEKAQDTRLLYKDIFIR